MGGDALEPVHRSAARPPLAGSCSAARPASSSLWNLGHVDARLDVEAVAAERRGPEIQASGSPCLRRRSLRSSVPSSGAAAMNSVASSSAATQPVAASRSTTFALIYDSLAGRPDVRTPGAAR